MAIYGFINNVENTRSLINHALINYTTESGYFYSDK